MRKPAIDFGPYRPTAATLWRPAHQDGFSPRYRRTEAIIGHLRDIERRDADLAHHDLDPKTRHDHFRDALAQNAFGTASIEGNPLTLEEVQSLLAKGPTPDNRVEPDEREILNFAHYMEHLADERFPRTVADVCALHDRHFEGVLETRGALKDRPNFIGQKKDRTVAYVPTLPDDVAAELQAALDWLHDEPEQPLLKATLFFHEFQSIHPFPDGNGRLGRLLFTHYLFAQGYHGIRYAPIDHAVNQDREHYWEMLDEGRRHEWDRTPWIAYNLRLLDEAYERALHRFLFAADLPPDLNERRRRIAEWFAELARANPARQVKIADVHAAFPTIPRRTLTADLRALVDAEVLHREGERRGTKYRLSRRS